MLTDVLPLSESEAGIAANVHALWIQAVVHCDGPRNVLKTQGRTCPFTATALTLQVSCKDMVKVDSAPLNLNKGRYLISGDPFSFGCAIMSFPPFTSATRPDGPADNGLGRCLHLGQPK